MRAPGDNFPSPGHKDGNEGTLPCTTAGRKTPAPRSTPGANPSQKKVITRDENAPTFLYVEDNRHVSLNMTGRELTQVRMVEEKETGFEI